MIFLEIHGHTPLKNEKPLLDSLSNSWNIDTGAYYGYGLTGIKISEWAELIEIITIPTDYRDVVEIK